MSYQLAIPRDDNDRVTSRNGFTLNRQYEIFWSNGRVGRVINDNGHDRIVPLDGGRSAHLLDRRGNPAGYFEIRDNPPEDGCGCTWCMARR